MVTICPRLPIEESLKLIAELGGCESISLVIGQHARTIYSWRTKGIPLAIIDELKRKVMANGVPIKPAFDRSDHNGGDRKSKRYKELKHGKT